MGDLDAPAPAPAPAVQQPAPDPLPTLKQEWLLVGVVSVLIALCVGIDAWKFPAETARGDKTPLLFVSAIVHMVGAGMWITMDRRRRKLEVGKWRFAAVFLGPIALCLYLLLEYKAKAALLIPLTLIVYVTTLVVPVFVVLLFRHVPA